MVKSLRTLRREGQEIFAASLAAVDPVRLIRSALKRRGAILSVGTRQYDLHRFGRVFVIGAGKASAAMAQGVEQVLGDRLDDGRVIVKDGYGKPLKKIRVIEAGHPVPDERGIRGTEDLLNLLAGTKKDDLVLSLLSGGGSALFDAYPEGMILADVRKATELLLACGATISEINSIRKHISRVKGGQLAVHAAPATLLTLVLSDVIGDPLDVIASGPTVPDPTTFADALSVLKKYRLRKIFPASIVKHLRRGEAGGVPETPKGRLSIFRKIENRIVGNNEMAVLAAAARARKLGYRPMVLTTSLQGEAREAAKFLAAVAKEVARSDRPVKKPACLIAGGETTVTIGGKGKGGRNQEMALAAAFEIAGEKGILFLSGGTDGSDGPTDAAGAMVDGNTLHRAGKKGLSAAAFLAHHDSYSFFDRLDGHIKTGSTFTNVMDLAILLVD